MAEVFFFIAGIGAVAGAIGVVSVRNPFYAVLSLVFHLLSLAALFLLLRAEFIAAAQVVVYAGAVMVLYVFVVAYVGGGPSRCACARRSRRAARRSRSSSRWRCSSSWPIAVLGSALKGIGTEGAPYQPGFGTPGADRRAAADEVPAARSRSRRSCC